MRCPALPCPALPCPAVQRVEWGGIAAARAIVPKTRQGVVDLDISREWPGAAARCRGRHPLLTLIIPPMCVAASLDSPQGCVHALPHPPALLLGLPSPGAGGKEERPVAAIDDTWLAGGADHEPQGDIPPCTGAPGCTGPVECTACCRPALARAMCALPHLRTPQPPCAVVVASVMLGLGRLSTSHRSITPPLRLLLCQSNRALRAYLPRRAGRYCG